MSTPLSEIGPVLPSRAAVYARARELEQLARRAVEFAGKGPSADLGRAVKQFERMRAVLGDGDER
jgi:hypothetical protein